MYKKSAIVAIGGFLFFAFVSNLHAEQCEDGYLGPPCSEGIDCVRFQNSCDPENPGKIRYPSSIATERNDAADDIVRRKYNNGQNTCSVQGTTLGHRAAECFNGSEYEGDSMVYHQVGGDIGFMGWDRFVGEDGYRNRFLMKSSTNSFHFSNPSPLGCDAVKEEVKNNSVGAFCVQGKTLYWVWDKGKQRVAGPTR